MFGHKKKSQDCVELSEIDDIVDRALVSFREGMTRIVPDIYTREDADRYVAKYADCILKQISDVSFAYSGSVIRLKKIKKDLDLGILSSFDAETAIGKLDLNIRLLEESYVQTFCIVNPESPRSMIHYYTRSEITDLCRHGRQPVRNENAGIPFDLADRLSDDYISRYLPDDHVVNACMYVPPGTSPETILKALCIGDFVGQSHDSGCDAESLFRPDASCHFTDNAVLSFAVYDVCRSIKMLENECISLCGIIPQAYDIFVHSLKYYAMMFPHTSYDPRFYAWAFNGTDSSGSLSNDGVARSCVIGSFFNDIKSVIRYAVVSAYVTHSHKTGEQGCVFAAVCTWLALHGASKCDIRGYVMSKADDIICTPCDLDGFPEKVFDLSLSPDDIAFLAENSGNTYTLSGVRTLSQAMICVLNASNVQTCMENAWKFPCDTASVSAINCGIGTAYFSRIGGDLPFADKLLSMKTNEDLSCETRHILKKLSEF